MLRAPLRAMICSRISSTVLPAACARCAHSCLVRFGFGGAGMDRIDIDAVALAELRQALAEHRERAVHRTADEEFRIGGARRSADDVDHVSLRRLEERPEHAGQSHGSE